MKKRGMPLLDELILHGEFTFNSGYENMALLLKRREKFDAVFVANDLIDCLTKHGIEVPREIIVAGYEDIRMAGWYTPSLTTVRQPVYQMGQKTVEILLALLSESEREIYTERFRPELTIRNSTKCLND